MDRKLKIYLVLAGLSVAMCAGLAVAAGRIGQRENKIPAVAVPAELGTNFPVHIRRPAGAPRVLTGATNFHGEPVAMSCATCHATSRPNPRTQSTAELDEFHQGLGFQHGGMSCLSCHNPGNYDTLRLANGDSLEFQNVMTLCGQCHGPQYRDYRNGSHGGMNGYWDLKSGPRTRNNCVDCHDPHAPQYRAVMPVFKPLDPVRRGKGNKH